MQPGPALQAVLLAVLLSEPRSSKGRLLSGEYAPLGRGLVPKRLVLMPPVHPSC